MTDTQPSTIDASLASNAVHAGLEKAISMVEEDDIEASCWTRTQDALLDAWDDVSRILSGETQLVSAKPTQLRPKRRVFVNMSLPDSYMDLAGFPTVTYPPNKIRTSKYTPWTFLPKFLFEQFRRIANSTFSFIVHEGLTKKSSFWSWPSLKLSQSLQSQIPSLRFFHCLLF